MCCDVLHQFYQFYLEQNLTGQYRGVSITAYYYIEFALRQTMPREVVSSLSTSSFLMMLGITVTF